MITITLGLGEEAQQKKLEDSGGKTPNPAVCVFLVPFSYEGLLDSKFDKIIASSDKQAVEKAQELSKKLKIPLEYFSKKLLYWDLGDLKEEPESTKLARLPFYMDFSPNEKISGGESFNNFKKRFFSEFENILEMAKEEKKRILIITHNDVCRLVDAWFEEKEEKPTVESEDEFYTVDSEKFLGKGFKNQDPLRVEWDGSEWHCEEFEEDSEYGE